MGGVVLPAALPTVLRAPLRRFNGIGRIDGRKGGDITKERYGIEFFQEVGRIGGSK